MGETLGGGQAFGADVAFVQEAVRIPLDLHDPVALGGHKKGAPAMVHS
jgi:hypothetical protein